MKFGLREVVFIILLMGIPVGAWRFVFRPNNARNDQMLHEIQAKQAKLQALNHATATIGDLKKEIEDLEKAIVFFQSKLPNEKEMDKVLKQVWRLAEANKLCTKSIRTLKRTGRCHEASSDQPQAEQPISMKIEGEFLGLYTFLQALENQPRIMRIHKIKLSRPRKGRMGHVEAEFEMSIFFERENKGETCPPNSST